MPKMKYMCTVKKSHCAYVVTKQVRCKPTIFSEYTLMSLYSGQSLIHTSYHDA